MKEPCIKYPQFDNNLTDFLNHTEALNETSKKLGTKNELN